MVVTIHFFCNYCNKIFPFQPSVKIPSACLLNIDSKNLFPYALSVKIIN